MVLAVAAVTGCTDDGPAGNTWAGGPSASATATAAPGAAPGAPAPAWTEPAAYGFVLVSSCGEPALRGRFRVTVAGGRVVAVQGLDESAKRATQTSESELVPTLGQLVEAVRTAREDGAEVVQSAADPADGHPTSVTIDPAVDGVDDGACYTVSEYTVTSPAAGG